MEHLKKYWGWYLLGVVVIFVLFAPKKWWTGNTFPLTGDPTADGMPCNVLDDAGNKTPGKLKNGKCITK